MHSDHLYLLSLPTKIYYLFPESFTIHFNFCSLLPEARVGGHGYSSLLVCLVCLFVCLFVMLGSAHLAATALHL